MNPVPMCQKNLWRWNLDHAQIFQQLGLTMNNPHNQVQARSGLKLTCCQRTKNKFVSAIKCSTYHMWVKLPIWYPVTTPGLTSNINLRRTVRLVVTELQEKTPYHILGKQRDQVNFCQALYPTILHGRWLGNSRFCSIRHLQWRSSYSVHS